MRNSDPVKPDVNPFAGLDDRAEPAEPAARSQAERVIAKFGGARNLMRAMAKLEHGKQRNACNVFRWTYPRSKGGTDGLIPTKSLSAVMEAARLEGIFLSPDDLYPGPRP